MQLAENDPYLLIIVWISIKQPIILVFPHSQNMNIVDQESFYSLLQYVKIVFIEKLWGRYQNVKSKVLYTALGLITEKVLLYGLMESPYDMSRL